MTGTFGSPLDDFWFFLMCPFLFVHPNLTYLETLYIFSLVFYIPPPPQYPFLITPLSSLGLFCRPDTCSFWPRLFFDFRHLCLNAIRPVPSLGLFPPLSNFFGSRRSRDFSR